MVDFNVLANEVSALNNIAISTFFVFFAVGLFPSYSDHYLNQPWPATSTTDHFFVFFVSLLFDWFTLALVTAPFELFVF